MRKTTSCPAKWSKNHDRSQRNIYGHNANIFVFHNYSRGFSCIKGLALVLGHFLDFYTIDCLVSSARSGLFTFIGIIVLI